MRNRKYILAVTALALLFIGYGCFGDKKEKKVDTPVEAPKVDDKAIAFQVFERIPKEDLYEGFQTKTYTCPDDCHRHFGDSEGNDMDAGLYMENGGNHRFTVDCFPLKNGGWLAMLVNEGCFDGCDQTVKTYIYKDDVLTPANGMLPVPTMEEMVAYPFLLYGISDDEINGFKSEWDERMLYNVKGDTLMVEAETLNYDEQFMSVLSARMYVWDGERFVPTLNNEARTYPLVDRDGLGGLHLNDSMPEELPGLSKRYEGEVLAFNRDGEPFVKLHPDGAGKIQAIDVFAKDLTYYRGKIGDTLNRLLYKGAAENKAYYKEGEFVVTEESEYSENRIDYVGPKDAIDGNFVDGEIANPKFKPDATVQYIRIYKPHHWENDTCDMQALKTALDESGLGGAYPDCLKAYYDVNSIYYFRELYNHSCDGYCDVFQYYLHCYPLKAGGFKVYVTTDWQPGDEGDDVDAGYSPIETYVFKDGKVTESEVEPGMNDYETNVGGFRFAKVIDIIFRDDAMEIVHRDDSNTEHRVEYTWDGTSMRKTNEGLYENEF